MKTGKNFSKIKRRVRTRSRIHGTKETPRLCVFRSNVAFYAQIINDEEGKTILAIDSREKNKEKKSPAAKAKAKNSYNKEKIEKIGEKLAQLAKDKGVKKVVFDRGGYSYHGKVKSFADGARKGGLIF